MEPKTEAGGVVLADGHTTFVSPPELGPLSLPREGARPAVGLELGPDRYDLVRLLGEGGMGVVYEAFDRDLRRTVALKMLRPGAPLDAGRFVEEARVGAGLEHPGIVPVIEVGITPGNRLYYTMPLIRGTTLRELLRRLRRKDPEALRQHTLARRLQAFVQLGHAVSYAHQRGLVHGDLKPENVMLADHGAVYVLDWGLSRRSGPGGAPGGRAPGGAGTPGYMAPEQARGGVADERSDVYGLGVMLYELLCLRRPHEGSREEILAALASEEPEPPQAWANAQTDVPLVLERACMAALRHRPEERIASARELVGEVQAWLDAEADHSYRHRRAEERAEEGRARLETYARQRDVVRRLEAEAAEQAVALAGSERREASRTLFDARDRCRAARDFLADAAAEAMAALESALALEGDNRTARALLAEYYWDRLAEAEERRDEPEVAFYTRRVAAHDDGRRARALEGHGSLVIASEPAGAEVWLHRHASEGCELVAREGLRLGEAPLGGVRLPIGSYLARLRLPGHREVRFPFLVSRLRQVEARVRLYPEEEIGPGFLYLPAGPFLQGGDRDVGDWGRRFSEPWVDGFFLAEHPVTIGEYLEFLDHLLETEGEEAALGRAPRPFTRAPTYLARTAAGEFALPDPDADGDRWQPRWPAVGVSWSDAVQFCRYRERREGRPYRLPTEAEWEKAARGADGRWYPWGNEFDPSLCNMRESLPGRPAPVPVDDFPADVSVYGIRGLAGNAREWTSSEWQPGRGGGTRVVRGGAWGNDRSACRAASRDWRGEETVNFFTGFRLALTAPRG